ncbi:MAG: ABC transporter permease [Treponema sp.]|nr:ABC transporter permease [Candidatus Treponema equifaecale]
MYQFKIGLRSLFYRKTQYISLFLVCAFGVAISLSSIFISKGMISAMTQKAEIYYGGDLVLMLGTEDDGITYFDYEEYVEKLKKIFPKDAVISPRQDFYAKQSAYYFEGVEALQRAIKGVDFDAEKPLFDKFNFTEGGIEGMKGSNGVLISLPIAKMLNVHIGDSITFMLKTWEGETNTLDVVVKGIFQDSSVFGMYTSYMDFNFIKTAYKRPGYKTNANRICINFPNRDLTHSEIQFYQSELEKVFNMYHLVEDKDDFIDSTDDFIEPTFGLIPLSANLTDVKIMQLAMDAVVSFIIFMLTVIIIAGIGSTYRVLIMKRINEIGIYMAIGMKKKNIILTLLFESFVLLVLGCVLGMILTGVFCGILSQFNFSFIPSFDLFLVKGNLKPGIDVIKSIMVVASVIVVTLLAVLYATCKSIKILPVKALATTE